MNRAFKLMVIVIAFVLLNACASTLKEQDFVNVRSIGIINNFPDKPNFVTIGTTIFNNEYAEIDDVQFSQTLTNTVIEHLEKKGLNAEVISEDKRNNFDMVIELTPRDVYSTPGTYGYGVNQRSIFGNPRQANTYVALNLTPYINGRKKCSACYLQKLMPIDIETLPAEWSLLTEKQKVQISDTLNQNIRSSLKELLIETGI